MSRRYHARFVISRNADAGRLTTSGGERATTGARPTPSVSQEPAPRRKSSGTASPKARKGRGLQKCPVCGRPRVRYRSKSAQFQVHWKKGESVRCVRGSYGGGSYHCVATLRGGQVMVTAAGTVTGAVMTYRARAISCSPPRRCPAGSYPAQRRAAGTGSPARWCSPAPSPAARRAPVRRTARRQPESRLADQIGEDRPEAAPGRRGTGAEQVGAGRAGGGRTRPRLAASGDAAQLRLDRVGPRHEHRGHRGRGRARQPERDQGGVPAPDLRYRDQGTHRAGPGAGCGG